MTVITYDAIEDLKNAIINDWNKGSLNAGQKPRVREIWEAKVVGFSNDRREDILLTPLPESIRPFALFGKHYWHEVPINIDIRTYASIARHNTVVKEVARIIKNIIRRSTQGFTDIIIESSTSNNADYRNMFRHTIKLRYRSSQGHDFV